MPSDILWGPTQQGPSVFRNTRTEFSLYTDIKPRTEARRLLHFHIDRRDVTEPRWAALLVYHRQCEQQETNTLFNRDESHGWEQKSLRDFSSRIT